MHEELIDRFGRTPEPAQALLACHRLRLLGKPLGVLKVDAASERTTVSVRHASRRSMPGKLILMVQKDGRFRFAGQDRVRIERPSRSTSGSR